MNRITSLPLLIAAIALFVSGAATAAEGTLFSVTANKKSYAGYTAMGKAPSGREFRLYYGTDGTVKYTDSKGNSQTGLWLLTDDGRMCYDWKRWRDRCYAHHKNGTLYQSYRDNKTKGSTFRLVKGDIGLK